MIPGDGIGPEVTPAATAVLDAAAARAGIGFAYDEFDWSCARFQRDGAMMPPDGIEQLRSYDAILLGAIGFPGVPDHVSLWGLVIPIRRAFDQYVNLRPVRSFPGVPGPLKSAHPIDLVIVRENVEGEYSELGGRAYSGTPWEQATQETLFTRRGVERIVEYAFRLAGERSGRLTSATKSNGIIHTMTFWDEIVSERAADWPAVTVNRVKSVASALMVDKANYRHFMAKEIHEQPEVVGHTIARYVDMTRECVALPVKLPFDFNEIKRVCIVACGTASYAGHIGKYWFERLARLPVEVDVASEFRYREAPLQKGDLAVVISQSGETADTLAALRYAKEQGLHTLAILNVPTSTIGREAEIVLPTLAGPEIGVASTKAFTCQLAVLASLAVAAGKARGALSDADEARLAHALIEVPRLIAEALMLEPQIERLARVIAKSTDVLYLGRGTSYPLAMEGALKLKEISYIHAEGYAAGELKHGPIALIDEKMPVVVIAPYDRIFEKTVSNMQEVAARGGRIILMTDPKGAAEATIDSLETIILPEMPATVTPLVYAIPMQLLAYHTAVIMGTDVDQPRNLAKSVTVE